MTIPVAALAVVLALAGAPQHSGDSQAPPADCPHHPAVAAEPAPASPSPYAGQQDRAVKALSEAEQQQLLAGHGMGLARAAELNHYPGPKHVLELEPSLGLTDAQITRTRAIFDEMQVRARALGREIVDLETALDARFAAGDLGEAALAQAIHEIGRRQAELRLTHLRAHLQMRAEMTPEQVTRYDELRGYGTGHSAHSSHPAGTTAAEGE